MRGTTVNTLVTRPRLLARRELEFHYFVRFMGRGFPSPASNCIHRRLGEDWVSTFDVNAFHGAIRRNERIHLHDSLKGHAARKGRIGWRYAVQ